MFHTFEFGTFDDITIENGARLSPVGKGNIKLIIGSKGSSQEFTLHDVLYVPTLACNFFSVSKFTEKGYSVGFSEEDCNLYDKQKQEHLIARVNEGVYQLIKPTAEDSCPKTNTSISPTRDN